MEDEKLRYECVKIALDGFHNEEVPIFLNEELAHPDLVKRSHKTRCDLIIEEANKLYTYVKGD